MSDPGAVGIIYKHGHAPARREALRLADWLKARGIAVHAQEMGPKSPHPESCAEPPGVALPLRWTVVLGGDGTLLGAARRLGRLGIPLLGVNLGGLGFLTSIPLERLYPAIEMMLAGELREEKRVMLQVRVLRSGEEACRFQVLNDAVINKGTLARIIDLDVRIDQEFLTTFRADGLIISTPTGSTAYNLSAGGPILYPTLENFVLTPICPFTLTNRPIIIPDSAVIEITMGKESEETVMLTFDGQVGFELIQGDRVILSKSQEKIRLLRSPDDSYFKILRTKLMWGGATHNRIHA